MEGPQVEERYRNGVPSFAIASEIVVAEKGSTNLILGETGAMFRSLGASIWDHQMPIRFGGIPLWHRMTVIRLTNGGLVVHSPTRLNPVSRQESRSSVPLLLLWRRVGGTIYICNSISTHIQRCASAELRRSPNAIDRCHLQKFSATRRLYFGKARLINNMFKGSVSF